MSRNEYGTKKDNLNSWVLLFIVFIIVSWQSNKCFWGLFVLFFSVISILLSENFNIFVENFSKSNVVKDKSINPKVLSNFKTQKSLILTNLMNFSAATVFIHIWYPKGIQKLVKLIEIAVPKHISAFAKISNSFLLNATTTLLLFITYIILTGLEMGVYTAWKNNFVNNK